MSELEIKIARDFSRYPGGRYRADGKYSGEEFRDDVLVPLLLDAKRQNKSITVELDGAAGYPSSFLEEAFGGLVRNRLFDKSELDNIMKINAGPLFESYKSLVEKYLKEARPEAVN